MRPAAVMRIFKKSFALDAQKDAASL